MAIDGTYITVTNTPMGAQESKFEIKTQGNVLTGTGSSQGNNDKLEDGKVEGNVATFSINTVGPFGPMKIDFTLTFDGDKVTGEAATPFGNMPVEGKRA